MHYELGDIVWLKTLLLKTLLYEALQFPSKYAIHVQIAIITMKDMKHIENYLIFLRL